MNFRTVYLVICYYSHAIVDIEFILLFCNISLPKYSVVIALHVTSIAVQNIIRLLIFLLFKDAM
jgi:hypothetical protein